MKNLKVTINRSAGVKKYEVLPRQEKDMRGCCFCIKKDVYKRQRSDCGYQPGTKQNRNTRPSVHQNGIWYGPVSYTHLDVYKRQCHGPACAADLSHADSGMGTEIDGDRKGRR